MYIFQIKWMDFKLQSGVECLKVERGDKLAVFIKEIPSSITYEWSFESETMPLARSFSRDEYPVVGENVTYDQLYFPFKFSIEAEIDIGKFQLFVNSFCIYHILKTVIRCDNGELIFKYNKLQQNKSVTIAH